MKKKAQDMALNFSNAVKLCLLIVLASVFQACTSVRALDDFVEGEAKVIETVMQDELGPPTK